jgi:Tol biopolymer transport system component
VDSSPQFSPDGSRIAFRSSRSGADEIWISDANGGNLRRLTSFRGALTGSPQWSPDGQQLAFESRASGAAQVYLMDRDGGAQRRFTTDSFNNSVPRWSRDGRYLYFASDRTGTWEVWRQPVRGGGATQVTTHGGFTAAESSDGKTLYFARSASPGIWSAPLQANGIAGAEQLVTGELDAGMWGNWALGAGGIYYLKGRELRHLTFGGVSRQILSLTAPPAALDSGLTVSPDERTVLFCQIDRTGSDILLVDPFR